MNVICQHCKAKLTIPDHKIPRDRESTIKCPKCRERIQIPAVKQQGTDRESSRQSFNLSPEDRIDALVCIGSDNLQKKVHSTIGQMGFNVEAVTDTRAALSKMEYHIFPLVIVDDAFDHDTGLSGIIDRMHAMDMSLRRRICLVWVSNQFNTNDDMAALHMSVNNIIHINDSAHLEPYLYKALTDHKNFYTVYNGALKQIGKA